MIRSRAFIVAVIVLLAVALSLIDRGADGTAAGPLDFAADVADRLLLLGAMWLIAVLVQRVGELEREAGDLRAGLGHVSDEAERWRASSRRLLQGLGEAIGQQFESWKLTPAEAEIAGLMLKGASLREIAVLRRTSEATIRQQAQGIYRKSGLANRSELAAFFLDDLFEAAESAIRDPAAPVRPAAPN